MDKKLIQDLAITDGIYDCICDPYDKLKNGDPYSSVMVDLERFAEKIVKECAKLADEPTSQPFDSYGKKIKHHFGVQE